MSTPAESIKRLQGFTDIRLAATRNAVTQRICPTETYLRLVLGEQNAFLLSSVIQVIS